MRPFIIVTVTDGNSLLPYDIEVPTDVPAKKILKDIVETLSAYSGNEDILNNAREIYSIRLGRSLFEEETFVDAGIWNGDVILIR